MAALTKKGNLRLGNLGSRGTVSLSHNMNKQERSVPYKRGARLAAPADRIITVTT